MRILNFFGKTNEIQRLKMYSEDLRAWGEALSEQNDAFREKITDLQKKNDALRAENRQLKSERSYALNSANDEIRRLKEYNQKLVRKIEEAEKTGEFAMPNLDEYGKVDGLRGLQATIQAWRSRKAAEKSELEGPVTDELRELDKVLEDMPIDVLELEARTYSCLRYHGIETLNDVVSHSMSELLKIRNFGKHCANDLAERLMETYGLKVADEKTLREQKKIDRILVPSRRRLTKIEDIGLSVETYNAIALWNARACWDDRIYSADNVYYRSEGALSRQIGEGPAKEVLNKMRDLGFLP